MARRRLLPDEQLAPFWAWATEEREIVRHHTLTSAVSAVRDQRKATHVEQTARRAKLQKYASRHLEVSVKTAFNLPVQPPRSPAETPHRGSQARVADR